MPDGYHPIVELLDECDCCTLYTSEELQDYEIVEMGLDLCTCVKECEAKIDEDCNGKAEWYVDGVECGYCCGPCSEHSPYDLEWLGDEE
jgi:hypothetical protein